MPDIPGTVLALIVAGSGIYAYVVKGNVPSFFTSLTVGIMLFLGSQRYSNGDPRFLLGASLFLASVMGYRFAITFKPVPPGLLLTLSTLLAIRCGYALWRKYQKPKK